jgi:hypothetical protein
MAGFRDSCAGVPGVPGEKSHLDVGPVESHRVNPLRGGGQQALQSWRVTEYTIRGKVVASPKSGPW